jgi:hypothetical protein
VVRPLRGSVRFRLPLRQRSVPLEDTVRVPFPSAINARDGSVRVTTAFGRRGTRSATLSGGRVLIRQGRGRRAPTGVRVLGPERTSCRRGAGDRVPGRLTVSSRGGFRTRGRFASATGRRATWLTEERCSGTLVRARRGRVVVIDLDRGRRAVLRSGGTYLARAR